MRYNVNKYTQGLKSSGYQLCLQKHYFLGLSIRNRKSFSYHGDESRGQLYSNIVTHMLGGKSVMLVYFQSNTNTNRYDGLLLALSFLLTIKSFSRKLCKSYLFSMYFVTSTQKLSWRYHWKILRHNIISWGSCFMRRALWKPHE